MNEPIVTESDLDEIIYTVGELLLIHHIRTILSAFSMEQRVRTVQKIVRWLQEEVNG